jgi:hypothetical protein
MWPLLSRRVRLSGFICQNPLVLASDEDEECGVARDPEPVILPAVTPQCVCASLNQNRRSISAIAALLIVGRLALLLQNIGLILVVQGFGDKLIGKLKVPLFAGLQCKRKQPRL